jgi:hypothetical protein
MLVSTYDFLQYQTLILQDQTLQVRKSRDPVIRCIISCIWRVFTGLYKVIVGQDTTCISFPTQTVQSATLTQKLLVLGTCG